MEFLQNSHETYEKLMQNSWEIYGKLWRNFCKSQGKSEGCSEHEWGELPQFSQ